MRFGLISANLMGNVDGAAAQETAQTAEEVGFDSLWAIEHVVVPKSYSSTYPYDEGGRLFKGASQLDHSDPLIWLAYAAAVTTRIRLATGILILPQRNPLILAKEIASLDRLCGGRFDFGIGVGWLREEFDALGVPFDRRGARTDEYISALRVLWTEEEAEFHGEFVDFDKLWSYPKPVQKPHPPIFMGGDGPTTFDRVVEFCDGWMPIARGAGQEGVLTEKIALLRKQAEDAGRDPNSLPVSLCIFGRADEALVSRMEEAGVNRLILNLPSDERDKVLPILDEYAALIS